MPKIGPNKVSVDPKAYAARITRAKKIVAAMDPGTKAKIKEMYPDIKKEAIVKKALDLKKAVAKKAAAKPMAKPTAKTPAKTTTKAPAKKPMGKLVGPAAVEALQKRVSPAGVKKAEMDAKKAIAKKYPGLTKKSK
jgi:histone H1/5